MTATAPAIEIRQLTSVEDFGRCVDLQSAIWGFADRDLIPKRMFVVAHKTGGLVLGAWDGATLAGFCMTLPGFRGAQRYWHSHMLAVLPNYRNRGLGRRMKLAQRAAGLDQGLDLMEWTFDPLEIKNSYLNLSLLGAVTRRYEPDIYGPTSSALQAGLPTDRLVAEWWLRSPRVAALADGQPSAPPVFERTVEVPAGIYAWKDAGDARAVAVQTRNREALQAAFAAGLAVVDYERRGDGDGVFRLGRFVGEHP